MKKTILRIAGALLLLLAASCGIFLYHSRYERNPLDTSASPDGKYILTLFTVGEPDRPFGRSNVRLVLSNGKEEIWKQDIDAAEDGCKISKSSWLVTWDSDRVWVRLRLSGSADKLWKLYYDGAAELIYPADEGIEMPTPVELKVSVNENGEAVFKIDMAEFIDCFNKYYRQDHELDYLRDLYDWDKLTVQGQDSEHDGIYYRFAADKEKYTQPELLVYMPADESGIYKIALSFDQHGYREDAFEEYREMCYCGLSCVLPDADRDHVNRLFSALYDTAVNVYPTQGEAQIIHAYDDIGIYTYFGGGTVNIGIIPLTETIETGFIAKGYEIKQGDK